MQEKIYTLLQKFPFVNRINNGIPLLDDGLQLSLWQQFEKIQLNSIH